MNINYEKKYNEALQRARLWKESNRTAVKQTIIEDIFPELAEVPSEDERIRNEIISFLDRNTYQFECDKDKYKGWIAWLIKQGKQETAEWKEGDFIRHGGILALVIKGRSAIKSNGKIITIQYPNEWTKLSPNEIEYFINEFIKQTPDKEEVLKGTRRGVALSIMDFIEANTQGMCMSNIECKNLEDAVVNNNWAKVYAFMKLKLDKQGLCRFEEVGRWGADVSEDERIRRDIISYFQLANQIIPQFQTDKWIAWLEKQGQVKESAISQHENQTCKENDDSLTRGKSVLEATEKEKVNNANEVEPKFDVDDWVVRKDGKNFADGRKTIRITRFDGERYWFDSGTYLQPKDIRLWNIADAKAGDVLDANGSPITYKKHDKDFVYFYCGVDLVDKFIVANGNDIWDDNYRVYPANKEQHDLLFSKMHEAGYEWDEKKLELKKRIE